MIDSLGSTDLDGQFFSFCDSKVRRLTFDENFGALREENEIKYNENKSAVKILNEDSIIEEPRLIKLGNGIYGVPNHPGAYFLPQCLNKTEQLNLASLCLSLCKNTSNKSNLGVEEERISFLNRKEECINSKQDVENGDVIIYPSDKIFVNKKLRWITLGYQYEWTKRIYGRYEPFPTILRDIACSVVSKIKIINPSFSEYDNYCPDTAILNFYRGSDRLRGHRDDVESNDRCPLISLSLGQPAVFLLGYPPKNNKNENNNYCNNEVNRDEDDVKMVPDVFVLRSGDVFVMSGEARYSLHSVPKLLYYNVPVEENSKIKNKNSSFKMNHQIFNSEDENYDSVAEVLSNLRMNLSIRQLKFVK